MSDEIVVPNGTYHMVVTDHCLSESQQGTPSVKVQLLVHESIENPEVDINKKMYIDLYLSDKAKPYTMKTLYKVLDWKGHTVKELNDGVVLRDQECYGYVVNENYERKITPKIKYLTKTLGMTRIGDDELGKFQDLDNDFEAYKNSDDINNDDHMPI